MDIPTPTTGTLYVVVDAALDSRGLQKLDRIDGT